MNFSVRLSPKQLSSIGVMSNLEFEDSSEFEQLEYLLLLLEPYIDSEKLASNLYNKFGCLLRILSAPVDKLIEVPGVNYSIAVFLNSIPSIAGLYDRLKLKNESIYLDSDIRIFKYAKTLFNSKEYSEYYLISLAANRKLLRHDRISIGTSHNSQIYIRNVIETALKHKSTVSIVIVKNIAFCTQIPLDHDIETARNISSALDTIGIRLLDFILVSDNNYIQLRKDGYLNSYWHWSLHSKNNNLSITV